MSHLLLRVEKQLRGFVFICIFCLRTNREGESADSNLYTVAYVYPCIYCPLPTSELLNKTYVFKICRFWGPLERGPNVRRLRFPYP